MAKGITKTEKSWIFTAIVSILCGYGGVSAYTYVEPINSTKTTVTLSSPDEFGDYNHKKWRALGRYLVDTKYKVYVLKWQGIGGFINYGKEFIRYMQISQRQGKKIIFEVSGPVISMHALASCYADKVKYNGNYLLFHADGYTWRNVYYRVSKYRSDIKEELNTCIDKGVFATKDYDKMWQGYEVHTTKTKVWYVRDPRPIG